MTQICPVGTSRSVRHDVYPWSGTDHDGLDYACHLATTKMANADAMPLRGMALNGDSSRIDFSGCTYTVEQAWAPIEALLGLVTAVK